MVWIMWRNKWIEDGDPGQEMTREAQQLGEPDEVHGTQGLLISPWTKWPPFWQTTFSNVFS